MDLSDKDFKVTILNVSKEIKDKNLVGKLETKEETNSRTENTITKNKSIEEFNSVLDAVEERISDWKIAQKKIQTKA